MATSNKCTKLFENTSTKFTSSNTSFYNNSKGVCKIKRYFLIFNLCENKLLTGCGFKTEHFRTFRNFKRNLFYT